jgi:hydrogenase-4 component B
MQYSSSSFARILVELFGTFLRPQGHRPGLKGYFPEASSYGSHLPETVLELGFLPLFRQADRRLATLRKLQHGQLHLYILYIFVTLVALLVWAQWPS